MKDTRVHGCYLPQAEEDNCPQSPAVPQVLFVFPASGRGLEQNRSPGKGNE